MFANLVLQNDAPGRTQCTPNPFNLSPYGGNSISVTPSGVDSCSISHITKIFLAAAATTQRVTITNALPNQVSGSVNFENNGNNTCPTGSQQVVC